MNKFDITITANDIDFILNRFVNLIRKRNYHLDEIYAKGGDNAYITAKITVKDTVDKDQVENQIKKIYDITEIKVKEIIGYRRDE